MNKKIAILLSLILGTAIIFPQAKAREQISSVELSSSLSADIGEIIERSGAVAAYRMDLIKADLKATIAEDSKMMIDAEANGGIGSLDKSVIGELGGSLGIGLALTNKEGRVLGYIVNVKFDGVSAEENEAFLRASAGVRLIYVDAETRIAIDLHPFAGMGGGISGEKWDKQLNGRSIQAFVEHELVKNSVKVVTKGDFLVDYDKGELWVGSIYGGVKIHIDGSFWVDLGMQGEHDINGRTTLNLFVGATLKL